MAPVKIKGIHGSKRVLTKAVVCFRLSGDPTGAVFRHYCYLVEKGNKNLLLGPDFFQGVKELDTLVLDKHPSGQEVRIPYKPQVKLPGIR